MQGKHPYGAPGIMGEFAGGTVMMDPTMMSAPIAGLTMDINEDSLDAPPSVSSTEAGPIMGTPSTPGTPAPSGKDKKVYLECRIFRIRGILVSIFRLVPKLYQPFNVLLLCFLPTISILEQGRQAKASHSIHFVRQFSTSASERCE